MPSPFADEALTQYMAGSGSDGPLSDLRVAEMREGGTRRAAARPRGPDMHEVRDLRVAGLDARLYRPTAAGGPLLVYLHGGGWTIGSLDTHDRACRRTRGRRRSMTRSSRSSGSINTAPS